MIFDWLFGRKPLHKVLYPETTVQLHGIRFTLRKLNPLDHLNGAHALRRVHDVYSKSVAKQEPIMDAQMAEKVRNHYRDVFMGGVVSVRCNRVELNPVRKDASVENKTILVDHLMTDWELSEALYQAIMEFTYGKKKIRQFATPRIA